MNTHDVSINLQKWSSFYQNGIIQTLYIYRPKCHKFTDILPKEPILSTKIRIHNSSNENIDTICPPNGPNESNLTNNRVIWELMTNECIYNVQHIIHIQYNYN